jgi:hypothetical protein
MVIRKQDLVSEPLDEARLELIVTHRALATPSAYRTLTLR